MKKYYQRGPFSSFRYDSIGHFWSTNLTYWPRWPWVKLVFFLLSLLILKNPTPLKHRKKGRVVNQKPCLRWWEYSHIPMNFMWGCALIMLSIPNGLLFHCVKCHVCQGFTPGWLFIPWVSVRLYTSLPLPPLIHREISLSHDNAVLFDGHPLVPKHWKTSGYCRWIGFPFINMTNRLPSLKLTAKAPENGWLEYFLVSFWKCLFSGANC